MAFGEFNFLPESMVSHPPTPSGESLWAWMQAVVRGASDVPGDRKHLHVPLMQALG